MSHNHPVFFESILFYRNSFPLIDFHYQRIQELSLFLQCEFAYSKENFIALLLSHTLGSEEQRLKFKFAIRDQQLIIESIEASFTRPNSYLNYPSIALTVYPKYRKPIAEEHKWKVENPNLYRDSILFAEHKNCQQALIINNREEIVETSLSNFYYFMGDTLYTTPLNSGAVNGVFRRYLMSETSIPEKALPLKDLKFIQECFVSSGIRGIVPVHSIDGISYPTYQTEDFRRIIKQKANLN